MIGRFSRLLFGISLIVMFAVEVQARTQRGEGLWLMLAGQGGLGSVDAELENFRWWLDLQPRFANAANGLGQTLVRPGLGYSFADNASHIFRCNGFDEFLVGGRAQC